MSWAHRRLSERLLGSNCIPTAARWLEILLDGSIVKTPPETVAALEQFTRAIRIDPSFYPAYAGRAWAHGMLGEFDEALVEIEKLKVSFSPGKDFPTTMTTS